MTERRDTPRYVLVIPDAGPLNSLWVADRLDLLLALEMPIVLVDEVYWETASDPDRYEKDRAIRDFVERHRGREVLVEDTFVGQAAREARAAGTFKTVKSLGEVAVAEFMANGIGRYLDGMEPVLLLFEDSDFRNVRLFRKPDNLHLLSTVGLLRGLEAAGIVASADEIIRSMTHPSEPKRQDSKRSFADLPHGIDEEAAIGSARKP